MNHFCYRVLALFQYTLLPAFCLCCISGISMGVETMNTGFVSAFRFQTELDPVYLRWVHAPGELRGFWFAYPREETRERTGANTFSSHTSLELVEDPNSPGGFRIDSPFAPVHSRVEMGFHVTQPVSSVQVLISTALEGAAGTAELYCVDRNGSRHLVGSSNQMNARKDSWVNIKPEGQTLSFPVGEYVLVVKPRKMKVEVWPGHAADPDTWISDHFAVDSSRQAQTALLARLMYPDGTLVNLRKDEDERPWLSLGSHEPGAEAKEAGMFLNVDLGEHNNPFFIYYPSAFQQAFPNAFMRDIDGKKIEIEANPIRGIRNPVPAVDDPQLRGLSKTLIQQGAEVLRYCPWLRYYVIAGEECYPDYFGTLPVGDFRQSFVDRFDLYSQQQGWGVVFNREQFRLQPEKELEKAWYLFREHALADRAADYMRTFLVNDAEHPAFYPTHGNPFFGPGQCGRKQLGYSPGMIAGACDGFETGQISIDQDVEWLNLLTLCHTASWGVPVVSPRLGNKTLDPSARGGGRSFTPTMLRRLAYEALGHGVWHIGLLQWTGTLGDGEWFIRDTPAEKEAREVFNEIESASPYLIGMSRLQPKVGLYISDSTWRNEGWQARWTGYYQDALKDHWQISIVGDEIVNEHLAEKVPVLVSLDNSLMSRSAIQGLIEFCKAGGRIIRWGAFAREDEFGNDITGDPFLNITNVVNLSQTPETEERELINAVTTGSGAHKCVTHYQAAPFKEIREAILQEESDTVLYPVRIETRGEVHAYTLTDGLNLVVVLVNHRSESASVTLEPPTLSSEYKGGWQWRRIDLPANTANELTAGNLSLTLPPLGSTLVWMSPGIDPSGLKERLVESSKVLERWEKMGVDVESLKFCRDEAGKAQLVGIDLKAFALSGKILQGLGIHADSVRESSGMLKIKASLFDPSGNPVLGASVTCRTVPGEFHWCSLQGSQPGVYEVIIPRDKRPVLFNPDKGQYELYSGPVRLIVHATHQDHEGYSLQTVMVGEAPY